MNKKQHRKAISSNFKKEDKYKVLKELIYEWIRHSYSQIGDGYSSNGRTLVYRGRIEAFNDVLRDISQLEREAVTSE